MKANNIKNTITKASASKKTMVFAIVLVVFLCYVSSVVSGGGNEDNIRFMFEEGTSVDEQEKVKSFAKTPKLKEMRKINGKLPPMVVIAKDSAQIEYDTIMILHNKGFKDNIPRVHGYKRNYLFMDYIDGVRLEDFQPTSENQLSSIIIQVLYTLYKINKKIPSFRHNDLHLENIMIVKDDVKNIVVSDHNGNRFQFNNEGVKIILIDFEKSHIKGVKNHQNFYNPNPIYDTHQFLTSIYLFLHNSSSQILKPMSNISSNTKTEIDNEITRILRYIEKKIEPHFLDYGNTKNEFIDNGFLTVKGQREIKNTLDDYISDIKLILT